NCCTLVFLSSLGAITFSRAASFDIVLTMTLTGAFACFLIAHVRHNLSSEVANATARQQHRLLFGFYVFIGLSLLAKGLVGLIIPIGVIAIYFMLRRERPNKSFLQSLWWGVPL